MTNIENILRANGPLLSGELIDIILKEDPSIGNDAIRKRISRLKYPVCRYYGYYAEKQRLFYLAEQFGTEQFSEALLLSFEKKAKRFDSIIKSLLFHGNYLHKNQLSAYSFSPTGNFTGHKLFSTVLAELIKLKIVFVEGEYYTLANRISQANFTKHKAVEMAKDLTLSHFMEWARDIGLTSYDSGKYFADFAKFNWCFTCPSYISSLTGFKDKKKLPAFVIADILIGKQIDVKDIEFFIQKIQICNSQKNLSKILPFLLFDDATIPAFKKLKAEGIIVGNLSKLFGFEYSAVLKELINTVTNAGTILKTNPENYFDFIDKINKLINGKTNNLRGDLFELAVGYYHSRDCKNLDIGKLINFEGKMRDADVFAVFSDKVIIAESKGYKSKISVEEIERWLSETIGIIRKYILSQDAYSNKELIFEFWSTGGFTEGARAKLDHAKNCKKYKVEYFGEAEIREKARKINLPKFTQILNQYFISEEL